jgi:hypothetical protein
MKAISIESFPEALLVCSGLIIDIRIRMGHCSFFAVSVIFLPHNLTV